MSRLLMMIGVSMGLWGSGCAPAPIEPAEKSPLISRFWVRALDDGTEFTDAIEIAERDGILAEIGFETSENGPESLEGRRVQKPESWPVCLRIYPRGGSPEDRQAIINPCNFFDHYEPIRNPRSGLTRMRKPRPFVRMPYVGASSRWFAAGFPGAPEAKDEWDVEDLRRWTYLTVGEKPAGDYVYEVAIFPTSFWISDVRFDPGPTVVLRRGLLRVMPSEE